MGASGAWGPTGPIGGWTSIAGVTGATGIAMHAAYVPSTINEEDSYLLYCNFYTNKTYYYIFCQGDMHKCAHILVDGILSNIKAYGSFTWGPFKFQIIDKELIITEVANISPDSEHTVSKLYEILRKFYSMKMFL